MRIHSRITHSIPSPDSIDALNLDEPQERISFGRYSVRKAIVGSILSARRVGTTQPSMQTPSMTNP